MNSSFQLASTRVEYSELVAHEGFEEASEDLHYGKHISTDSSTASYVVAAQRRKVGITTYGIF
ncbi:MAG: hypothetical protein DRO12_00890 [Thermoprotei archaeon]|nr:MAG: hypothetical protein DRO12_00890 [Thermoprotei archaeon]